MGIQRMAVQAIRVQKITLKIMTMGFMRISQKKSTIIRRKK